MSVSLFFSRLGAQLTKNTKTAISDIAALGKMSPEAKDNIYSVIKNLSPEALEENRSAYAKVLGDALRKEGIDDPRARQRILKEMLNSVQETSEAAPAASVKESKTVSKMEEASPSADDSDVSQPEAPKARKSRAKKSSDAAEAFAESADDGGVTPSALGGGADLEGALVGRDITAARVARADTNQKKANEKLDHRIRMRYHTKGLFFGAFRRTDTLEAKERAFMVASQRGDVEGSPSMALDLYTMARGSKEEKELIARLGDAHPRKPEDIKKAILSDDGHLDEKVDNMELSVDERTNALFTINKEARITEDERAILLAHLKQDMQQLQVGNVAKDLRPMWNNSEKGPTSLEPLPEESFTQFGKLYDLFQDQEYIAERQKLKPEAGKGNEKYIGKIIDKLQDDRLLSEPERARLDGYLGRFHSFKDEDDAPGFFHKMSRHLEKRGLPSLEKISIWGGVGVGLPGALLAGSALLSSKGDEGGDDYASQVVQPPYVSGAPYPAGAPNQQSSGGGWGSTANRPGLLTRTYELGHKLLDRTETGIEGKAREITGGATAVTATLEAYKNQKRQILYEEVEKINTGIGSNLPGGALNNDQLNEMAGLVTSLMENRMNDRKLTISEGLESYKEGLIQSALKHGSSIDSATLDKVVKEVNRAIEHKKDTNTLDDVAISSAPSVKKMDLGLN